MIRWGRVAFSFTIFFSANFPERPNFGQEFSTPFKLRVELRRSSGKDALLD